MGLYTDITIVVQAFAYEGENVPCWIDVYARGTPVNVLVAVQLNSQYLSVFPAYPQLIQANQTFRFGVSLITMPNHNITYTAETFIEQLPGQWIPDDTVTHTVELTGPPPPPPPPLDGIISRKEFEYDGIHATIPVTANIPNDRRGLVHIWGRNNMKTSQKLGIHWLVSDPQGNTVENYRDWQSFTTSPGDEHEFLGGRFDLTTPGKYTIYIELLMNEPNPIVVDVWYGNLCTVKLVELKPRFANLRVAYHKEPVDGAEIYLGDSLVFQVTFDYQGPKLIPDGPFVRVSIGVRGITFNEKIGKETDLTLPETPSWHTYIATYGIYLSDISQPGQVGTIQPGTGYDLEVKIGSIPGQTDLFWREDNAIDILPGITPEPEFSDFTISISKT